MPAFSFVEPNPRLERESAFRTAPGDSDALRGVVGRILVAFFACRSRQIVCAGMAKDGKQEKVRAEVRRAQARFELTGSRRYEQELARVISAFGNRKDPRSWSK
jgi:hypothetical protein